jgi:hypothetical protein
MYLLVRGELPQGGGTQDWLKASDCEARWPCQATCRRLGPLVRSKTAIQRSVTGLY